MKHCRFWAPVLYFICLSFCVRAPQFVMDDAQQFAYVNGLDSFWALFGCDSFNLFRPVKNLLFAAFALLRDGDDLLGCRLLAIAIGIASYFPVLGLMRRLFRRELPAVLAASVWLLAPTQVSSVAWLSAVNIQVMCLFVALSLSAHLDDRPFRAALLAFLAMASYESAVALLPLFFALDFYLRSDRLRGVRGWTPYVAYALAGAVYLGLRGLLGGAEQVNGSFTGTTRIDMMMAAAHFTLKHFSVWWWPFGRVAVAGSYRLGEVSQLELLADWAVLAALVLAALLLRRRRPLSGLGLAVALIAFVPTSNLFGLGNGPWGDYYLGLTSLGFSIVLADAVDGLWQNRARCGNWVFAVIALVLGMRLVAVPESARWASVWGSGLQALAETEDTFPKSYTATIMLAQQACDAHCWDLALAYAAKAEAAAGLDSDIAVAADVCRGLVALNGEKNAEKALAYFERCERSPHAVGSLRRSCRYYRGCVYDDLLNDPQQAEVLYASALPKRLNADAAQAAGRLAALRARRGNLASAYDLLEKAVRILPGDTVLRHNLEIIRARCAADGKEAGGRAVVP